MKGDQGNEKERQSGEILKVEQSCNNCNISDSSDQPEIVRDYLEWWMEILELNLEALEASVFGEICPKSNELEEWREWVYLNQDIVQKPARLC